MLVNEYKIYGSKLPSPDNPNPPVYVSTVFAKNPIVARSKHNKLMRTQKKLKSAKSLVLKIEQIPQPDDKVVRNYAVRLVFKSKRGKKIAMYKEVRATSRCEAVGTIYSDMAGRHSVNPSLVDIVSVEEISNDELKRDYVKQYVGDDVEYPVERRALNLKSVVFVDDAEKVFN